jgi:hypothetical protein
MPVRSKFDVRVKTGTVIKLCIKGRGTVVRAVRLHKFANHISLWVKGLKQKIIQTIKRGARLQCELRDPCSDQRWAEHADVAIMLNLGKVDIG